VIPIDTATGRQSGSLVHDGTVLVVKGWLVTLADGHECRLGPDETRAKLYAAQQHGTAEPLYVRRPAANSGTTQG
jgi:hypothetical protein